MLTAGGAGGNGSWLREHCSQSSGTLLKILFVTMQYGAGYVQGTERYLGSLGASLRGRGHEVSFLAGDPLKQRDRAAGLGQSVGRDAAGEILGYPSRGWLAVVGTPVRQVRDWLQRHRPDVVHVANPAHVGIGAMVAARRLGIPVVVTVMDFWWLCPKATLLRADGALCDGRPGWAECVQCIARDNPRGWVRAVGQLPQPASPLTLGLMFARSGLRGLSPGDMLRWVRRRELLLKELEAAAEVIYPSRAVSEPLQARLRTHRGRMIPYGLSREWFERPREPRRRPVDAAGLVVGFAGALLPHKGPHLLLEAVRRLGWVKTPIRLAGPLPEGEYGQRLRGLADGLDVEFLGRVNGTKMPEFLRSLDVLAMTSLWPENLPFIMLEAQAAGVPVVGSRLAGVADQVGCEQLLFEPGSAEGLARALEHVRVHPEAITAPRVRTIEEMTGETEAVYREVVGGG